MHVTRSPRAAVCSTSCSPSFTMSPSPCSGEARPSRAHALHAGGDRRRASVQRLHRGRRRSSARSSCSSRCPATRDRSLARPRAPASASRYTRTASGSPQPGQMWSLREQQVGLEVGELPGVRGRCARVEHGPDRAASDCRHDILLSTVLVHRQGRKRGVGLAAVQREDPVADHLGVEQRPDAEARAVGRDPADARPARGPSTPRRTSSIIWPAHSSNTPTRRRARGRVAPPRRTGTARA